MSNNPWTRPDLAKRPTFDWRVAEPSKALRDMKQDFPLGTYWSDECAERYGAMVGLGRYMCDNVERLGPLFPVGSSTVSLALRDLNLILPNVAPRLDETTGCVVETDRLLRAIFRRLDGVAVDLPAGAIPVAEDIEIRLLWMATYDGAPGGLITH